MAIVKEINGRKVTFDVGTDGDGNAALEVTHVDGVECIAGLLAGVTPEGKLIRYAFVNDEIGLKLNSDGYIKQIKENI